jgi:hypothetical protein
LEFEWLQFFHHPVLKIMKGVADSAAQNDNFRIVGVKDSHDGIGQGFTKAGEHFDGLGVAGLGALFKLNGIHAEVPLKIPAAAVVLKFTFLVGRMADFTSAPVAAGIKFAINNDAGTQAGAKDESDEIFATTPESVVKFAQCETFGVVIDVRGDFESLFQKFLERHFAPCGDIGDIIDNAVFDKAGCANADATDAGLKDG